MEKHSRNMDDFEVKRANIRHHDVEAEFFEKIHPEGSSLYERAKVLESLAFIARNSASFNVCIDVGCGTGFVTGFELPLYKMVVAVDISRRMLEVVRKRFGDFDSLNLIVCDAEFLPFKDEVADFISISSVLHHLPKPLNLLTDIARVLKGDGLLYITREPNFQRLRRFSDFFDQVIVKKFVKFIQRLPVFRSEPKPMPNIVVEGLDYATVDIHYPTGLHVAQLAEFLRSKSFEIIRAYSYHWIYPNSSRELLQQLLTKSNFVIERIPLSNKLGRYVSVIAKKTMKTDRVKKTIFK